MSKWKGIVGVGMSINDFRAHVEGLRFAAWRPSFLVIHNTGAPTLAQWHSTPGVQRMKNLESYYRGLGWSAGPHAFIADDLIWLFTPFTVPGVHSPSWNGTSIGIELVGDYSVEDPDSGPGLHVKQNAIAAFAILHAKLGIDPSTIKLHKEDPRTTHNCPGIRLSMQKLRFIDAVAEYMGEGGGHGDNISQDGKPSDPTPRAGRVAVPADDYLNMREGSSASSRIVATMARGTNVSIIGEAVNGSTKWLHVNSVDGSGWVAARYIEEA